MGGFFFDRKCAALLVEIDHAKALRVLDPVAKHGCALRLSDGTDELVAEALAVEDVVSQNQADRVIANELLANKEGLGQPVGRGLLCKGDLQAKLAAVSQQLTILWQVLGRRDHQDFADTGQHQYRNRVIDHRFVVYGQQLLGDAQGDWVQACT
ncbi:hypothetical protein D3C76_1123500 [compost metagenome]